MDQELDPNRPYWTETDRFPVGTRVRIHLSPEEFLAPLGVSINYAEKVGVPGSLTQMPHPPGADGCTGTITPFPPTFEAGFQLPGHTLYVRFSQPLIVLTPGALISRLRVHGDTFAPTELEVLS